MTTAQERAKQRQTRQQPVPRSEQPTATANQGSRTPPSDEAAEKSLLCSLILWPEKLDDVMLEITPEDLYFTDRHRPILEAMLKLQSANKPIDLITLAAQLTTDKQIDRVGGPDGLVQLASLEPHGGHAVHYAKIVAEKAHRRALIYAGQDAQVSAYDSSLTVQEAAGDADTKITAVLERLAGKSEATMEAAVQDLMERLEGKRPSGLLTGFSGFDALTYGLQPGNLVIIAARPSMGKTALAVNVMENVARSGRSVGIISLEQSVTELCDRMVCGASKLSTAVLRNPHTLTEAQRDSIMTAIAELCQLPVCYDDRPQSIVTLEATARIMKRRDKIDLLIIDYLQIIAAEDRREPREQQVSDISRRLKRLAKTLEIPIICLAQLNRDVEKSTDKKPRLSHLRESGAIEQDADIVTFLHRPDYYETGEQSGAAEWIIAKHRNGQTGEIPLKFEKQFMRFVDAAPDHAAMRERSETGPTLYGGSGFDDDFSATYGGAA